jgi:hypothetical protein
MPTIRQLIVQIHDRYGERIASATAGTEVPPALVAAFIVNESGRDRNGTIIDSARRFEKHVYAALVSIRDRGYRIVKGKRINNYSGITQQQIKDASNDALKALATSWGTLQIMGWHCINNLMDIDGTPVTISELRDPDRHIAYAVQLLRRTAGKYIRAKRYKEVFRIWNTGSPTGTTYHPNYVSNGLVAMDIWNDLYGKIRTIKFDVAHIVGDAPDLLTEFTTPDLEGGHELASDNDLELDSSGTDLEGVEVPDDEIPLATDAPDGQNRPSTEGGQPAVEVQHADTVEVAPQNPVAGGAASSDPVPVTEENYIDKVKRIPAKIYALIGGSAAITYERIMTGLGWAAENREVIYIVLIIIAGITLYLMNNSNKVKLEQMRQKHQYEIERMKIAANPQMQTVK